MSDVLDAIEAFSDQLASVRWTPLGPAVLCHLAEILARSTRGGTSSPRHIPTRACTERDVLAAYVAGTGINGR